MPESVVTLVFPAKADYLLLARLALTGLARRAGLDDETLADLKLAVTEACGNAVRHAYGDGEGTVSVVFVLAGERLEMLVEDQGSGFEPGTTLDAELADLESPEGGMGMAIIRAVVDEVDVSDGDEGRGTVVRMTKYLQRAAA